MNISELSQKTVKELKLIAKELGITGCRKLKKSEIVELILKSKEKSAKSASKKTPKNSKNSKECDEPKAQPSRKKEPKKVAKESAPTDTVAKQQPAPAPTAKLTANPDTKPKPEPIPDASPSLSAPARRETAADPGSSLQKFKESLGKARNISGIYEEVNGVNRDRFVLLVRDPYWLHVYWELCTRLIERAKAAMGHSWHTAVPVLRLFQIVADGVNNPRRDHLRDIRIHGGVNNWYIDVQNPPGTFQVEIGFLSREGNFFPISSTNIVQTPQSQVLSGGSLDGHWESVSEDFDRIYKLSGGTEESNGQLRAVFEEQLHRSMSMPLISRFGSRSTIYERTKRHFQFTVDADVILYGTTDPSVQVSIKGEPIHVENNGTFSVRFILAEKRQVFPIEAKGSDGIETQQVIIAIDRNTKVLETVFLDNDEDD